MLIDPPEYLRFLCASGASKTPTAATGPTAPEGRLALLRDIATEMASLAYYRITGSL